MPSSDWDTNKGNKNLKGRREEGNERNKGAARIAKTEEVRK